MHRLVTQKTAGNCTVEVANGGGFGLGAAYMRNFYITFNVDDFTISFSEVNYTDEIDIVAI